MAHKLGAHLHIPHGIANAYLMCQVIKYNSSECPTKQTAFPQYKYPFAKHRYAEVATILGLKGKTDDEKVDSLIEALQEIKKAIKIPLSMKEGGVKKEDLEKALKNGLAEEAYDDQSTGANPRYPLFKEIEELYWKAYNGEI